MGIQKTIALKLINYYHANRQSVTEATRINRYNSCYLRILSKIMITYKHTSTESEMTDSDGNVFILATVSVINYISIITL